MANVVDMSAHIYSGDRTRFPLAQRLRGKLPVWAKGRQSLPAEEFLDLMRENGVYQAALVHQMAVYDTDHSYVLDVRKRYPESFVVMGAIDIAYRHALSMAAWLAEEPVDILRFEHADAMDPELWLNAPQTTPLWEEASRAGIPVSIPFVQMRHVPTLRRVIERYPSIPMLLRRLGGPPTEDGPPYIAAQDFFSLAEFPNVYFIFSRENIRAAEKGKSTPRAFFETCISKFGAKRLMWGSYYGTNVATGDMQYKDLIDDVRNGLSFLGQEDRDFLLGESARSLLPGLRSAVA
ncbi:MAG TPA: amidohydrolase family protein [Dehalococcoidia bacterium]|nr:amidohydrolase family protein [Dehalococcoidia bacterium]